MEMKESALNELKRMYALKKRDIVVRLREFEKVRTDGTDEEIFTELAFCLLTPQSKAKSCWEAISDIKDQKLLVKGDATDLKGSLKCVRFHNKKAQYLVEARRRFLNDGRISLRPWLKGCGDVFECREWLVKNIKGMGYKEASHFLRNIGLGQDISILDRHILRNLNAFGIVEEIPESLGRATYLRIERAMADFSSRISIPLSHLDLLLWYKETGEIFK